MKHANLSIFIPHAGCKHRCTFCDQNRISGQIKAPSLNEIQEMIRTCVESPKHRADSTQIAFFGGSFTCIPRDQMLTYLKLASEYVENGLFSGIRISTRPDGINTEILDILKRHHVTHIELGAQSMDPSVLLQARRGHTPEDTKNAARMIRDAGFVLGLQMLIGLPGDSKEIAYRTAKQLAALQPCEMRLYPISVFPDTALYEQYQHGDYQPLTTEQAVEWIVPIAAYLEEKSIRLLRIGLHQADGAVAGAFHPAFGELVKTGVFNSKLRKLLPPSPANLIIQVPINMLSIANGQKRSNLIYWQKQGYVLRFEGNASNDITIMNKKDP